MKEKSSDVSLEKIQEIFKLAMGNNVLVQMETKKDDIAEWDSINHLNLIVELESAFSPGLSMEEIEKLDSVSLIVTLLNSRKV